MTYRGPKGAKYAPKTRRAVEGPIGPRTRDEQRIADSRPGEYEWPKSARRVGCDHEFLILRDRERYGKKETSRECLNCGSHLQPIVGWTWHEDGRYVRGDKERPRIMRRLCPLADAPLVDAKAKRFSLPAA